MCKTTQKLKGRLEEIAFVSTTNRDLKYVTLYAFWQWISSVCISVNKTLHQSDDITAVLIEEGR